MSKMTVIDFMNLPTVDLMGWWIYHEDSGIKQNEPEDYAKIVAAYDALGREGVSSILSEGGYEKDDPDVKVISLAVAKGFLSKMKSTSDSRIFSVEFVKRTDGTYRKMLCRYGVTKHLKGGEKSFDDKDYDLNTVWDTQADPKPSNKERIANIQEGTPLRVSKGDYRSIPLENIIRLTIGGRQYIIEENKDKVNLLVN